MKEMKLQKDEEEIRKEMARIKKEMEEERQKKAHDELRQSFSCVVSVSENAAKMLERCQLENHIPYFYSVVDWKLGC